MARGLVRHWCRDGVGNPLAIRANQSALAADGLPEQEAYPRKHRLATLAGFVTAGALVGWVVR